MGSGTDVVRGRHRRWALLGAGAAVVGGSIFLPAIDFPGAPPRWDADWISAMSTFWGFSGAMALLTVELRRDARTHAERQEQEREARAGLYIIWQSTPMGDRRGGYAMMHNTGKLPVKGIKVLDEGKLRTPYPLPLQPGDRLPAFGDLYERTDPKLTLYFEDVRGQKYRRDPDWTLTPIDAYPDLVLWREPETDEWGRPIPKLPAPQAPQTPTDAPSSEA